MSTISVNGVEIPESAIRAEMQQHPAGSLAEARKAAAEALVVRELLLQEARRLGLRPDPRTDEAGRRETDEDSLARQLIEREVAVPEPDEDSCRRYYERNPGRFRAPGPLSGRRLPFDMVREAIGDYLRERAWRRAVAQYIQILAGRARIDGIAIKSADSPLVQ